MSGEPVQAVSRSGTVTINSKVLIAANAARSKFFIQNDTPYSVWINLIGPASSVAGNGNIRIAARESFELEDATNEVQAVVAKGSVDLTAYEFFKGAVAA